MNLLTDNFFRQLVSRAIRTDYLENITGFAWLFIQPLLLLAIYTFVFSTIFKARIPDSGTVGFMPYLAVAFWPWTAFSESVLRASNSISANAALIGKVAIPTEMIPLSTVTAAFMMHLVGYLAVLVVIQLTGTPVHWMGLFAALPLLMLMFLFACGLSLFISALQVFIRDVSQILPPLMTFWFFGTPILYGTSVLPENIAALMKFNPMTWYVERLRDFLLFGHYDFTIQDLLVPALTILVLFAGFRFFRRISSHFEDFL
ncbi:MAG: ABC transporter permease [Xanthomonadales bacterium]|jgi:ABC-type polysaccharide/polyol phosphate export permease|nr:ABC transporter permease [Xanthomonadales bacterium]